MTTSRSILALAFGAMLATASAAQAQWIPGTPYYGGQPVYVPPVYAPMPQAQLMPEGHPPGERPWAFEHFFLWHDGGGWHLRVTSSGRYHTYSGWVDSPNGLGGVNAVIAGTPLSVNARQIQFNVGVQGGENGFDWQQQDPCATFDLLFDGVQAAALIDIGAYSQHPPGFAPFQVCSSAPQQPPPPPQVAEAEPPPEEVSTPAGPEMDPEAFQSVLSPYGQWVNVDPYGLIWQPNPEVVGPDFVPYQNGHWIMTDAGWTWASDFAWGWGPFHYGNWIHTDAGWGWVPGRVWAPAWVSWRFGGGYSGWGPLGYGGEEIVYPGYHYVYVDNGHFGDAHYRDHRVPADRIEVVERGARPMPTRYANGHPVVSTNAGPPRSEIEHASGHPIHPVPLAQVAKQQHMTPPAGAKGVHYAKGASPSHPFVAQKVQATSHPPAGGAGQHGGRAEGGNHGGASGQQGREAGRSGEAGGQQGREAGRSGGGEQQGREAGGQHPEERSAGGQQRSEERSGGEQGGGSHASPPPPKPKPAAPPPPPPKKKK